VTLFQSFRSFHSLTLAATEGGIPTNGAYGASGGRNEA